MADWTDKWREWAVQAQARQLQENEENSLRLHDPVSSAQVLREEAMMLALCSIAETLEEMAKVGRWKR